MKTSVKVTIRGERDEVEVYFEFDLSDEAEASRFGKLRDLLKESGTVTDSRQNFFYQIGSLLKGIEGLGD